MTDVQANRIADLLGQIANSTPRDGARLSRELLGVMAQEWDDDAHPTPPAPAVPPVCPPKELEF